MARKHLPSCPACGFTVLVRDEDWPAGQVECLGCLAWRGTVADLTPPRRQRGQAPPAAVVIVGPAGLRRDGAGDGD